MGHTNYAHSSTCFPPLLFARWPALLQILDRYRLHFPFPPMPPEKRQAVLAWRAKKQAAEAAQQAQQRGQAAAAQAERPHKKLRRAGEVEQDALRDAMEDGSPPPATLGTQRHKRKQQQVLSDSDSEGEGGEEEGSEDSRPLALRAQQRSVARTPAVQLLPDSEDNCPLQQQQQQQPKKQRQGPGETRRVVGFGGDGGWWSRAEMLASVTGRVHVALLRAPKLASHSITTAVCRR